MSLFFGRTPEPEQRSSDWVDFGHGGGNIGAVNEEKARRLAYVFAAIRHIADFGGTLPLESFRRVGDERRPAPLPVLFRSKLDNGTLVPWLTQAFASLAASGNAVGQVKDVDGYGYPRDVLWLPRSRYSFDDAGWKVDGQPVDSSDIVHIPWIVPPGEMLGISPLAAYQASVEAAQAGQAYTAGWYNAGGIPPGTFRNRERIITPAQSDEIRDRLVSSIRTGKPLVYGNDWEYEAVTVAPEQAAFVESQKLTAGQIAAVYGIEPQEIGGEAANGLTYNNEEHRQTKRLANMRPYLTRVEHAFNAITPVEQRVRFNGDAIIRADIKTRWAVYKVGRELQVLSRNEIRALEDQPPIPGGDAYDDHVATPNTAPGTTDGLDEDEAPRRLHIIPKEHRA